MKHQPKNVSFVALVIRFLIALLPFATNNTGFRNIPLEGAIPEEIGRLSALTSLDLAGTSLNGTLPDGLYDLTALEKASSFECIS